MNTSLCYIEKDGAYLMLHRVKKKNDYNAGKWIGIGGKFEKDESPVECMKREVFEETGLKVLNFRYRGIISFCSDTANETEYMHIFTCDGFDGEIKDCDEGELKWVNIEDIESLPLWEGDKVFLKLLRDDASFFSLKLVYKNDVLVDSVVDFI